MLPATFPIKLLILVAAKEVPNTSGFAPPKFPATIEFRTFTVPPLVAMPPPTARAGAVAVAVLAVMVLLVRVAVAPLLTKIAAPAP